MNEFINNLEKEIEKKLKKNRVRGLKYHEEVP